MNLCRCGCGTHVARQWVKGHHWSARRFYNYIPEDRGHSSPCWIWQGVPEASGYARVQYRGRRWAVHRAFYTQLVGEIPPGLTIDHLCRTRLCVNPEHLEPVTHVENAKRGRIAQDTDGTSKGKIWDQSELRQLASLSAVGLSDKEISSSLGRSPAAVSAARHAYGIRKRIKCPEGRTVK
jgi:hypothetical protein